MHHFMLLKNGTFVFFLKFLRALGIIFCVLELPSTNLFVIHVNVCEFFTVQVPEHMNNSVTRRLVLTFSNHRRTSQFGDGTPRNHSSGLRL